MTRLEDCTRDYLGWIRHEKGYSQRTLETYSSWSRHYLRWLGENGYPDPDLTAFATPVLRRYLYHLSSRMRPRSVRSAFYPLRGMAKFLVETGAIASDPVREIAMPKKDAPVRRMVSDGNIAALLAACERLHHPRKIALYRAVISTLTFTGVRIQELRNLQVEHVDAERRMLTVHAGKGSKTGHLYPCDEWWQAYREWTLQREDDTKHPYLFSVDRGRRLGTEGVYRILDETSAIAGLDRAPRCHEFRRSLTVRLLAKGASLREVSAVLRHALLSTTLEYALELGGEAKAMASLGSLIAPPSPIGGAGGTTRVDDAPVAPPTGADQDAGKVRQLSRAEEFRRMRRRSTR